MLFSILFYTKTCVKNIYPFQNPTGPSGREFYSKNWMARNHQANFIKDSYITSKLEIFKNLCKFHVKYLSIQTLCTIIRRPTLGEIFLGILHNQIGKFIVFSTPKIQNLTCKKIPKFFFGFQNSKFFSSSC